MSIPIEHTTSLPQRTPSQPSRRIRQLRHMIGNTPLLAIRFSFRGRERVIYAKAEHLNMTGSIKDRMAFHILKKLCTKSSEYHPRQWVDCYLRPTKLMSKNLEIPPTAVGGLFNFNVCFPAPQMNYPPTAVGGILRLRARYVGTS